MEESLKHIELDKLREKMHKVMHDSYSDNTFQVFMSVVTHAITCKDCSREFYHSIAIAKDHLNSQLK